MRTPPFLLGATLLFWGWQSGLLIPGAVMAAALEGARWVKNRWDVSNEDFARIWVFCSLVFLATIVYAFTANQGLGELRGLFEHPSPLATRNVGTASARTAASIFRWLPMSFFLFVAAQEYSSREGLPLETISRIVARRWKRARKGEQPSPASRSVNISYPYFALCLVAASAHSAEDRTFFWGLCALLGWGLWPQRSKRFALPVWVGSLALAVGLGYLGQRGVGYLQSYINNINPEWLGRWSRRRFDSTQSRTELGNIGRLKTSGKIVLRLDAGKGPPPELLREASYLDYLGITWVAGISTNESEQINPEVPNGNTYVLQRGKTNSATVNIACYLDGGQGLLP